MMRCFFFNDTATTEIYTLSLHDALPIYVELLGDQLGHHRLRAVPPERAGVQRRGDGAGGVDAQRHALRAAGHRGVRLRSEEHTSELQSRQYLVCRLLLEKKKKFRHQNLD